MLEFTPPVEDFIGHGAVQAWLDESGVNSVAGGVHRHLTWAGIDQVADTGDQRRLWLDATGLARADAVTTEHAPWYALSLEETTEHHFVSAPSQFAVVIPRRIGPSADEFAEAVRSGTRRQP